VFQRRKSPRSSANIITVTLDDLSIVERDNFVHVLQRLESVGHPQQGST
jgi:hypothetical protein